MNSISLIGDALRWAFHTFADHLPLFGRLLLISTLITLGVTVITLGGAFLFISFYITLCFINIALQLYDGKLVHGYESFFVGFMPFLKGLIALCLYSLIVLLGTLFFVIPGIYLASRYYYIIYCIMSDNAGIIDSFKCSWRVTEQLQWHGFLLMCCATLFGGIWFLLPVAALMNVYAYKRCQTMYH